MPRTRGKRRRGPNDAGTISQLPSGRWRVRVRVDGRQLSYGTFQTEQEAFDAQARWRLTHLLPADDPADTEAPPASVAVGGVRCDDWFHRWQLAKAERNSVVRVGSSRGGAASTAARDRAQWNRWWSPAIGNRLPHTLVRDDLIAVIRAMETSGRSPNTIRTHWVMIRSLLNWLVSEAVIAKNPLERVALAVDPADDRVRHIVVPDFTFIDLLVRRLPTDEDHLIFELLLGTGGRRSEVAGLTVGDIDLAAGRVWIRQPVVEVEGKLVRQARPKGGRSRSMVIGPQLALLLRAHMMRMGSVDDDTPLFLGARGGGLRWANYIQRRFRPAVASAAARWAVLERKKLMAAGWSKSSATERALTEAVKLRGLTPHHLRHTAAALLWASGASDMEVRMILGHADIETSRRLYGHLLADSEVTAASRVEQLRQARRLN